MRLSRPRLQLLWPLRVHAVAEDHQSRRLRACLSGRGAPSLRVGVAGRSCARRSGARARPALERRSGVGRRRQAHPSRVRLQADRRQPDGPHARDVRARRFDRPALDRGGAVRGHARQQAATSRAGCATSTRPRSGACSSSGSTAGRPARSIAGRSSTSRRRAPSPSTSASRRRGPARPRATAPGRQRLRAQHDDARDRADLPLLLGVRAQLQPRRPAHHDADPRGRLGRVRRGRGGPGGAAAGRRRPPRQGVLQPQHRRRGDVGAAPDRPHDGRRGPDARYADRRRSPSRTSERRRASRPPRPTPSGWAWRRPRPWPLGTSAGAGPRRPRRRPTCA